MIMSDEEKRTTAYHEAGHALVAMLTPASDPVHKVTIIPRGMALGVTQTLPDRGPLQPARATRCSRCIKHAMGGRAAEELVFGHFSTGAANDLQQATRLARDMVCKYGMSDAHRAGFVRRRRRGRVPRARLHDAQGLQREEGRADRRRGAADADDALRRGEASARSRTATRSTASPSALLERETLDTATCKLLIAGETLPPLPLPTCECRRRARAASRREPKFAIREPAGDPRRQAARSGADPGLARDESEVRGRCERPIFPPRPRDDASAC